MGKIAASATMASILVATCIEAQVYAWNVTSIGIDPIDSANVYAGTDAGIYKSIDGGATWFAIDARGILSLAIDPLTPSTLYAGHDLGIRESTDGGGSWVELDTGYSNASPRALVVDPMQPATLYATTFLEGTPILKSLNGGLTWSPIGRNQHLSFAVVLSLAIDPASSAEIYAGAMRYTFFGIDYGGLYYSANEGLSWTGKNAGLPLPHPNVYAIALSGTSEKYIATDSGIFKWMSNSWTLMSEVVATAMASDPTSSSTVYAGGISGMHKTTDAGASWNPINDGLLDRPVHVIAIDPFTPSIVYVGASNKIYKSTDGGASWNLIFSSGLRVPRLAEPRPPTRTLPPRPVI